MLFRSMSNQMEKLLSEVKEFTEGMIVKGHVLEVRPSEVLVDIGYKSEGAIAASEFDDASALKPGDEVEVLIEKLEDEDGIRDDLVTGVQTCALPISSGFGRLGWRVGAISSRSARSSGRVPSCVFRGRRRGSWAS